jgi:branched-chain amino acid transport system permease protein
MSTGEFRVEHATRASRVGLTILAVALVLLVAAPYWAGRAELRLFAEIFAYLALASLWNLLAGYAGLVSVGQQAFVGLGAYLLFGLAIFAGIPPLWTIPIAGLIAAVVAVPVAWLIFRLRGAYFAIGTWVVPKFSACSRRRFPRSAAAPERVCPPTSSCRSQPAGRCASL